MGGGLGGRRLARRHGGSWGGGGWHGGGGSWGGGWHGGGYHSHYCCAFPAFGFGLGLAIGSAWWDPWYWGGPYYGYYGYPPNYGYSYGYPPPTAYDGYTAPPPGAAPRPSAPAACGSWQWDASRQQYNWIPCGAPPAPTT